MSCVVEILRSEADGRLSFGDYSLTAKKKVEDFKAGNDIYKCKSYNEMTRLEKNDLFLYESEPGTAVFDFVETSTGVEFEVCGKDDAQITIGLAEDSEYSVYIDEVNTGKMKTNLSGKLSISVELAENRKVKVKIIKQ